MQLRPTLLSDLPFIHEIYAYHVLNGLASFEEEPPPVEEIRRRYDEVIGCGLPYLAAEEAGDGTKP